MKSGICPKCGSVDIYFRLRNGGGYGTNMLPLGGKWSVNFAQLDSYVCTNCGYVESYISDSYMLNRIVEKWERVDGEKRKRNLG